MKKLEEKMFSALDMQTALSETEKVKIQYALEVIKNEGIKTVILLAFFWCIGYIEAFLLCMAIACTVRIFAGGMHMKTNIGCFILSFTLLYSEIVLLPKVMVAEWALELILLGSVLCICLLSPLASYKRPFHSRKRYLACKRNAIIFSLLWGALLLFLISNPWLKACGVWCLTLQALQMVLTWLYRHFRKGGTSHV